MKGTTMKRFFLMTTALLMFAAFDAAALPKTHAKQVTVDPAGLSHSTNTTAQLVLEDVDGAIPEFASSAEVLEGTNATKSVSPATLKFGLTDTFFHANASYPSGTNGGTITGSVWTVRALNTVLTNSISTASLSNKTVYLPAGKYFFEARASVYGASLQMIIVRELVSSNIVATGNACGIVPGEGYSYMFQSVATGFVVAQTQIALRIEQRSASTVTTSGLGKAAGFGIPEVYAELLVFKLKGD
jgi:hypothetical protein